MNTPTWGDLARMLSIDPASDVWADEAIAFLAESHNDNDPPFAPLDLIEVASATASKVQTQMGNDLSHAEELKIVASVAKRAAVQLLVAAWAAEAALVGAV